MNRQHSAARHPGQSLGGGSRTTELSGNGLPSWVNTVSDMHALRTCSYAPFPRQQRGISSSEYEQNKKKKMWDPENLKKSKCKGSIWNSWDGGRAGELGSRAGAGRQCYKWGTPRICSRGRGPTPSSGELGPTPKGTPTGTGCV